MSCGDGCGSHESAAEPKIVGVGSLQFSEKAVSKVKELMTKEKKTNAGLRISVVPGGCSGFMYEFSFDDKAGSDDMTIDAKGLKIFVDKQSNKMLQGAKVDFVDGLQGSGFKIDNPNATQSCGCGSSFG